MAVNKDLLAIEPNLGYPTNEPDLYTLIEHYYASHDCDNYKELAKAYFDKWIDMMNEPEDC